MLYKVRRNNEREMEFKCGEWDEKKRVQDRNARLDSTEGVRRLRRERGGNGERGKEKK